MNISNYAGTHNHTDYSNIRGLDSINKVSALIDRALEANLSGLAITDHETLSGHVKAIQYYDGLVSNAQSKYDSEPSEKNKNNLEKVKNFKLMLGNEIYLVRNGLDRHNYNKEVESFYHFILIAKDEVGHEQLRELSSRAWMQGWHAGIIERVPTYYSDIEQVVGKNKGHLIATTACLGGFLGKHFMKMAKTHDQTERERLHEQVVAFLNWGKDMFGDDFHIELQPSNNMDQRNYNQYAMRAAKAMGIKNTIATDAHYLTKEHRPVHKSYLNAGDDKDREIDAFYETTYVMTKEEIWEYMKEDFSLEQVNEFLGNTLTIADSCEFYDLSHKPIVPKSEIPKIFTVPVPEESKGLEFLTNFINSPHDVDRYLAKLVIESIDEKISAEERNDAFKRVDMEFKELWELSEKMGDQMSAYLLIVKEIIDIIWDKGDSLVGPSRGSALGFLIDYLIGVTQISPLNKEIPLPHWRFINSQRVSLPD